MLGNIPLILISSANINKKIDINVTSALKMMFYNTKKICVKQITQIFFKLLLIRGVCLYFFLRVWARGDRRWNRLERGKRYIGPGGNRATPFAARYSLPCDGWLLYSEPKLPGREQNLRLWLEASFPLRCLGRVPR